MAGNCLTISTAVLTDAVYADELLSVKLFLGPHGPDNINHVARVFMAINESKDLLSALYRRLLDIHRTPSAPKPTAKALWPNPTANPPDSTIQFPILNFLCKANRADGTKHWGQGPLETGGNMSGTLKGEDPFTWHVTTNPSLNAPAMYPHIPCGFHLFFESIASCSVSCSQ